MKKTFLLFLSLVILSGCSTSQPNVERGRHGSIAYYILVESSEPNTRIEVNGDYVGKAPCEIKVFGDKHGRFMNLGNSRVAISAFPPLEGQYGQTKSFYAGSEEGEIGGQIPKRVFFDMNLSPVNPGLNLNIHDN